MTKGTFVRFLERQNFFGQCVRERLFDLFIWGVISSLCSLTKLLQSSRHDPQAFAKALATPALLTAR